MCGLYVTNLQAKKPCFPFLISRCREKLYVLPFVTSPPNGGDGLWMANAVAVPTRQGTVGRLELDEPTSTIEQKKHHVSGNQSRTKQIEAFFIFREGKSEATQSTNYQPHGNNVGP
jgi:hypothetical protein